MLSAVFSIRARKRNKSLRGLGDGMLTVLIDAGLPGIL